jgi:hypothetical protein
VDISAHVWCECEALETLRHTYLGSFFLDPENVRRLSLGAISNSIKRNWAPMTWTLGARRVFKKAYVRRDRKGSNPFTVLF